MTTGSGDDVAVTRFRWVGRMEWMRVAPLRFIATPTEDTESIRG